METSRERPGTPARWKASTALAAALFTLWSSASRADWREDLGTFKIGMVAEPGAANTVPGLAQLTDAYAGALGMKVEIFVARDYAALIDAQASGRVQYAIYSATAYAAASLRCGCVEPIAAPVDADGAVGIRSVLVTRGARLAALDAMATHRIAIGPPDSVAASLLPRAGMAEAGVTIPADVMQSESGSAAEAMLVSGGADAVFGWMPAAPDGQQDVAGGTVARLEAAGLRPAGLQVLWKSALLRYGPHAVRSDVDPEAKRRLRQFLVDLKSGQPDVYDLLESKHSGGFVAAKPADYEPAVAMVRFAAGAPPAPVSSPSK